MKVKLGEILKCEKKEILELLDTLEIQHNYIIKNDLVSLETITDRLHKISIKIAAVETERRKLTNGESMSKIVNELNDKKIEKDYREIKKLLHATQIQKETNETLTKQSLIFANKMLATLNPSKKSKTYNSYGKIGKY